MKKLFILGFILFATLFLSTFALALPSGITIIPGTSGRANATNAASDPNAIAGNITELTVTGISITQSWQGYFGNVTGAIELKDISNNVMYNWSLTSPEGEIYGSNASSINWNAIACANTTGNFSEFEQRFGLGVLDVDGLNETFNLNNHPGFFTNSKQFTGGQCNNTKLFNSAGVGTFNEVLLTDGPNLVFASLLLDNANGFDNKPHDFEMIVLEDGHGTNTALTTYYFWAELE